MNKLFRTFKRYVSYLYNIRSDRIMGAIGHKTTSLRFQTVKAVLRLLESGEVSTQKEGLEKVLNIAKKKKVRCGFSLDKDFDKNYRIYRYYKSMYATEFADFY